MCVWSHPKTMKKGTRCSTRHKGNFALHELEYNLLGVRIDPFREDHSILRIHCCALSNPQLENVDS